MRQIKISDPSKCPCRRTRQVLYSTENEYLCIHKEAVLVDDDNRPDCHLNTFPDACPLEKDTHIEAVSDALSNMWAIMFHHGNEMPPDLMARINNILSKAINAKNKNS